MWTLDRIAVVKGEIRIADRAYLQPDRMAKVIDAGADVVIRAGWKSARWVDEAGNAIDVVAELRDATAFGILKLTLKPNSYDWQFISEAGKSFTDSGSGNCHGKS